MLRPGGAGDAVGGLLRPGGGPVEWLLLNRGGGGVDRPGVPSFGCGNPLAFAEVKPGETVVDLGSGPGFDLIQAAKRVGPSGLVIGVDMTDAMIEEARRNAARAGFANIEVRKGLIENLPVAAGSVDWVISNCVINLSPEKPRVFAEIARVLRPGGRFRISDIVVESLPEWIRTNAAAYAACVAGAIPEREYVAGLEAAGLVDVKVESRLVYDAAQIRSLVDHDLSELRPRARRDRGRLRRGRRKGLERLLQRNQGLIARRAMRSSDAGCAACSGREARAAPPTPHSAHSSDLDDLPRIEYPPGIERVLDRAHRRDLRRGPAQRQIVALLEADAVLGRHRAAALAQRAIDDALDLVSRVATSPLPTPTMTCRLPSPRWPNTTSAGSFHFASSAAPHLGDVARHVGDRQAHVVGEDRRQARELLDVVAHRPQLVALGA